MATRSRRRKRARGGSPIDDDSGAPVITVTPAATRMAPTKAATAAAATTTTPPALTTAAATTTTPTTGKENKRSKGRKVTGLPSTPTERARLPATPAADTPSSAGMTATAAAQPEAGAEMMNIKVEPFDVTSDLEDAPDVKPDVQVLQQEFLEQQLQQQQQLQVPLHLPPLSLPLPPPLLPAPSVTGRGKRVFIIGDLATLTSLANSTNGGLPCLTGASGEVVALGSGGGGGGSGGTAGEALVMGTDEAIASVVTSPGSRLTMATPATPSVTLASSCLQEGTIQRDEFDLQHSDTDEDGYSDIVFDEDEDDELVEDEDDVDQYDPSWSDLPTMPRLVFPFDRPLADVGLEGRPKSTNPTFYFAKIIGDLDLFCSLLAAGANERTRQLFGPLAELVESLQAITSDEIRIFLALCLQMSTMRLPTLAEYWNDQALYNFNGFASKMPFDRFKLIMRVWNFENMGQRHRPVGEMSDAFGELRPLLDYFNQRMADVYKCGQRLVLNEPAIFWKGQCHWLRDVSEKFRNNAISLHFLTEHTGLMLHIVMDVERPERKNLLRNSKQLAQYRAALSKELLQDNLGHGHTAHISKYYSSYGLASELACHRTYSTGLLDSKRYGNCKDLIMTPVKRNEFAVKYAPPLMMGKWRRCTKCVYFYSSDCLAIYASETSWRLRDPRPKVVKEVEWQLKIPANIREAMMRYQFVLDASSEIKWDKKLAIYILNLMMLNAYILYTMYAQFGRSRVIPFSTKDSSQLKTYAEFRQQVIADLLATEWGDLAGAERAEQAVNTKTKSRSSGGSAGAATTDHPEKINSSATNTTPEASESAIEKGSKKSSGAMDTTANIPNQLTSPRLAALKHAVAPIPRQRGKVMRKRCRVCRKGGMLTLSKSFCESCPGMPGLCATPCFKIWHDQLERSMSAGGPSQTRGRK